LLGYSSISGNGAVSLELGTQFKQFSLVHQILNNSFIEYLLDYSEMHFFEESGIIVDVIVREASYEG
jgi:hypothetical protein